MGVSRVGARRIHAELVHGRGVAAVRCTVGLVMRRTNIVGLPGRPLLPQV